MLSRSSTGSAGTRSCGGTASDVRRSYLLLIDGKEYDSKAVVGAAHGFLLKQEPLGSEDFSGGRTHAVKLLRDLGFHTGAALVQGGISLFAVFEGA